MIEAIIDGCAGGTVIYRDIFACGIGYPLRIV